MDCALRSFPIKELNASIKCTNTLKMEKNGTSHRSILSVPLTVFADEYIYLFRYTESVSEDTSKRDSIVGKSKKKSSSANVTVGYIHYTDKLNHTFTHIINQFILFSSIKSMFYHQNTFRSKNQSHRTTEVNKEIDCLEMCVVRYME